jgi:hypothetical protein
MHHLLLHLPTAALRDEAWLRKGHLQSSFVKYVQHLPSKHSSATLLGSTARTHASKSYLLQVATLAASAYWSYRMQTGRWLRKPPHCQRSSAAAWCLGTWREHSAIAKTPRERDMLPCCCYYNLEGKMGSSSPTYCISATVILLHMLASESPNGSSNSHGAADISASIRRCTALNFEKRFLISETMLAACATSSGASCRLLVVSHASSGEL